MTPTGQIELKAPTHNELSSLAELAKSPPEEVVELLQTNAGNGLSTETARQRLERAGRNEVKAVSRTSNTELLLRQFASSVVVLLLAASAISVFTGDHLQAVGILIAVFINAFVGFFTELRAKVSLEALEDIAAPLARVVRSGHQHTVAAAELVCGDLVVLEPGSRIPADLRIVEAASLCIDESVLTGESLPQSKSATPVDEESESETIAYHGTYVVDGRGLAVVVKTGKDTSLGELQVSLIEGHSVQTPLEQRLEHLGKQMSVLTVIACVSIAAIGLAYGHGFWAMLEASIALAVAAIPEGLPVVATLALALGTLRMAKLGSLIRQLSAVEALGCTTVICADKTGTLTQNKLQVTDIVFDERRVELSGVGYAPDGELTEDGTSVDVGKEPVLSLLLKAASLCNDASLDFDEEAGEWLVHGDPTEGALLVASRKAGLDPQAVKKEMPRIDEVPFDLNSKKMITRHIEESGQLVSYIKGSPEVLIQQSETRQSATTVVPLDDQDRLRYLGWNEELARRGLRVIALASSAPENEDDHLTLLGLVGMRDLPRQGVEEAIRQCKTAGIRIMVLTGDQKTTAESIARDIGIIEKGEENRVLIGEELESVDGDLESASVIARVNPSMKLGIVKKLQNLGHVVAMTGDGVNDAPALQQANIGVSMGKTGTDLAREASRMVITDDNFATIVTAVEQGRVIYENIKKSICYLLTAALASVIAVAVVIIVDGTLAMLPLQLLWLNLIMHIFPGLGIVLQEAAPGIMQRSPRATDEPIMGRFETEQIVVRSVIVSAGVLAALYWARYFYGHDLNTTTIAFMTISLGLLYQAWSWLHASEERERAKTNRFMYLMMAVSYLCAFAALYLPGLQLVLKTVPLDIPGLVICIVCATAFHFVSMLYESIRLKSGKWGKNTG